MIENGTASFKRSKIRFVYIAGGAIIVLLAAAAGYFYWQYTTIRNNPNIVADQNTTRLTSEVGKLYDLPTNEKPSVAQISDKSKLGSQPFFANAQNGDYILIYTKNKLALVYRESSNKIINVGPVSIDQNTQSAAKANVKVINASSSSNVNSVVSKLQGNFDSSVTVDSSRDSAKNKSTKTTVVALNNQDDSLAQQIATKLGTSVGNVPSGEPTPSGADIVIYVGQP